MTEKMSATNQSTSGYDCETLRVNYPPWPIGKAQTNKSCREVFDLFTNCMKKRNIFSPRPT